MLEHNNSSKCRRPATITAPFNANTLQRYMTSVNAICKALLYPVYASVTNALAYGFAAGRQFTRA